MALRVLMLRKKLGEKQEALAELRKAAEGFSAREAELTKAIDEAGTPDEKAAVEEAIEQFEREQSDNAAGISRLDGEIADVEKEIEELERSAPVPTGGGKAARKENKTHMEIHSYQAMTAEQRSAFVGQEAVKDFLEQVRGLARTGGSQRGITGTELTIPEIVLPLLTDATERYSKLMKHVNVKPVKGKARVNVLGVVPEAVWTEQGGKINELSFGFTGSEIDGFKVAGFFALPDWVIEDSDENLMGIVVDNLGQSIGLAVDKAILYGTGAKMPLGIVTRLVQTAEPDAGTAHADAVAWKDLHTSNVASIAASNTGVKLFQELLKKSGAAKSNYSNGAKFWAMNDTTLNNLKAEALSVNAAGAIVTGMGGEMPIIGGKVETLSFIPDNVIIGGYGSLYLLGQRSSAAIATSEHVRFLEDQTVAKGIARYDGMAVIPAAFVAMGMNGATVSASAVTFAADTANP